MAEKALFGMPRVPLTADRQRRQEQQQHRRSLRIAIRQLERAELYLVALHSLDLDDPEAEASVDDIVQRIRLLERTFVQRRISA
jgi:hypothetical protein